MKDLILITTHAPDDSRRDILRNFVNSINKDLFDIMVVSHSSIPEDIINSIDYFIYDAKNDILTGTKHKYSMFFNSANFQVVSTENRTFNHTLAALKLVTLGLSTSRNEGYKKVHCIEYDTEMESDQEFIENSKLLEENSLVYYKTDHTPTLISFPVSFNLNKIHPQWFEFDKEYLEEWITNTPYKTIENYESLLIKKESTPYSKFYTKLKENGLIINLYYSGGEDVWVTPVEDNVLQLFLFNESTKMNKQDIPLYNVQVIVNNKDYLNLDVPLNVWKMQPLKNFDDITTLTIIRNGIKIQDYNFNKIDKKQYQSSNYIKLI